ncbi:MAG: TlpA family protein disulfide reductase [Actinobacteria bacterium]|nr:TlpA family protein disulfide reductase [Actinomycetota bacterium]
MRARPKPARPAGRRGWRLPWWIAALLALAALSIAIVAGIVAGGDLGGTQVEDRSPGSSQATFDPSALKPRKGSGPLLPDFSLAAFGGQGEVTGADFRGTPLVLNFWASWCPFCIEEMPGFERVNREFGGAVTFLGVDLQDDRALAEDLAVRTGVTYRLAEDPEGSLFAAVGGLGMPTTLIVSADGHIEEKVTGPLEPDQLRRLILENLFEEA